ncbi:MAG: hypothetical protein CMP10_11460 [Zetaproteobacteria bacterium]|nr:hypothetical protein [Pseudobdellovibrionaceae bacterium]
MKDIKHIIDQLVDYQSAQIYSDSDMPFVLLTYAQTLDGSISEAPLSRTPISNQASLRFSHQLRSLHDGIMVGYRTVIADNPRLTNRLFTGASPQPIVLATDGRLPIGCHLAGMRGRNPWVVSSRQPKISDGNIINIVVDTDSDGRVCIQSGLRALFKRGIRTLMVEGGARVIDSLLRLGLVDYQITSISPRLFLQSSSVQYAKIDKRVNLDLKEPVFAQLDSDIIVAGKPVFAEKDTVITNSSSTLPSAILQ